MLSVSSGGRQPCAVGGRWQGQAAEPAASCARLPPFVLARLRGPAHLRRARPRRWPCRLRQVG